MTLPCLPGAEVRVTLGVDTHADVHVVVALDQFGRRLGACTVTTTQAGSRKLLAWASRFGPIEQVGCEGTSSWGLGLARFLRAHGLLVIEVNRPSRQTRRRRGKSDPIDAEAAARAVQAGTATTVAKTADGQVEMIRTLRLVRRSALKARTQAANQLQSLVVTAPDQLREQLRRLSLDRLAATAAQLDPGSMTSLLAASTLALRVGRGALPAAVGRDHRLEPAAGAAGRHGRAEAAGAARGRHRHRRCAAGGCRRQPRAPAQRGRLRAPVRRRTDPSVLWQDHPASAAPGRQP